MTAKRWVPLVEEWTWLVLFLVFCAACASESAPPSSADNDSDEQSRNGESDCACVSDFDCQLGDICIDCHCIGGGAGPCSESNNPEAECRQDRDCLIDEYCDENTCKCLPIGGDLDGEVPYYEWDCDKLPCIQIAPTVLGYGAVQYLETARNTFNIRNRGGATLDILSMEFTALSSQDFKWPDNQEPDVPIHLEPGQTMQFEVDLTPTDLGVDSATIQIICNDLSNDTGKYRVLLQSECKGSAQIDVMPIEYDFGPVEVGESAPLQITIRNLNPDHPNEPDPIPPERCKLLAIQGIQLDPETTRHFRLQNDLSFPVYIPPSDTFQFRVFYEPKANGVHDAKVRILHDADRNPYSPDAPSMPVEVDLTGMGAIPCLSVEPDPVDFGKVTIGYQISIPVKLRSVCGGTVRMCGCDWRAPLEPAFTIQDPTAACHSEIPVNSSRTFWLDFLPTSRRFYGVVMKLCSNDSEKPTWLLGVEGEGAEGGPHVEPNPILFGSVLVGTDETFIYKIINSGTGEVMLQGVDFQYEGPQPGTPSPFSLDSEDVSALPIVIPGATPGGEPGTVDITIHYQPVAQAQGWEDVATMVLQTNNHSQPTYEVILRGSPIWPICEFSLINENTEVVPDFNGIIDFGEVNLSTSKTQKLRIANEGEYVCKVLSVALGPNTSSEFDAFPRLPVDIQPGDHHDILVSYAPVYYPGRDSGSIFVETNDLRSDNQYFEARLAGFGVNPTICVTPETSLSDPYDFGEAPLNTCSEPQEFIIRNCGVGTLEVECDNGQPNIAGCNGSPAVGPCQLRPYTPQTPDEITFTEQFCPGPYMATQLCEIRIKSNDTHHPGYVIHVKGKGTFCLPDPPGDPTCTDPCASGQSTHEVCDGYDNNCDGQTDEGFGRGEPCEAPSGCGAGAVQCNPNDPLRQPTICSTEPGGTDYQGSPELCDGLDNDCNDLTDEYVDSQGVLREIGEPCVYAVGICGAQISKTECNPRDPSMSAIFCSTQPGGSQSLATEEICNGLDDDCDGYVDEGFVLTGPDAVDLLNCGGCNRVCTVETNGEQTGTPECVAGRCRIQSCFPGLIDADGRIETGCECPVDDPCNGARRIGGGVEEEATP
ncbi:MAG: choice-of-anchor D domain-containing protein [Myxococcales bacterium]|nr:MAG: choice-of-anchor D domain-containing protein [Myxococcales bacterium]